MVTESDLLTGVSQRASLASGQNFLRQLSIVLAFGYCTYQGTRKLNK